MRYLLISLLLISDAIHASEISQAENLKIWVACQDKIGDSTEAKRLEDLAGRTAVIELVDKKCGFRPTVIRDKWRVGLDEKACAKLFNWNSNGDCSLGDTVEHDLFIRTLNPRIFNGKKYSARCMRNQAAGHVDDYQSFRNEICEAKRGKN